jgi:rhamnogalacturonyl hydrolase YesR
VQLWADNVYMVPPFLAYYGVTTNNKTVVDEAYNQIKAYREILQDTSTKLWRHMSPGWEANDPSLWATGNAWVVAGAARVIATIKGSEFASDMSSEVEDLQTWAGEIFTASKDHIVSSVG